MKIQHLSTEQALNSLKTSPEGLTGATAAKRLAEFGPNRIPKIAQKPLYVKFLREFTHLLALILWFAAFLAFVAYFLSQDEGMLTLGFAILGVVVINGIFSFWQEYRAERALSALEKLLPHTSNVMRDGSVAALSVDRIVPGDILVLEEGDSVPADCRLIESFGIRVNLATVTGEGLPKARDSAPSTSEDPLSAQNVLLAGTSVVSGRGKGVVFATGSHTEFSKIANLTQMTPDAPSPLQVEIASTSRRICLVAVTVGLFFFALGHLVGITFWANFIFAIGIIVAFVPEGMLPTVTLSLALVAQRMARKNGLVRHLSAIEALGSATVIVTDKTGTLTTGIMEVRTISVNGASLAVGELDLGDPATQALLDVAAICNDLKVDAQGNFLGDPMEIALAGLVPKKPEFKRLDEIPFEADRKRLSVLAVKNGSIHLYTKGAPETVLPLCRSILQNGVRSEIGEELREEIERTQEKLGDEGLRVLAFAVKEVDGTKAEGQEEGLTFVGLVALLDPPRPEVAGAIAKCRDAGIKVLMATGDNPRTALAIAREIGLVCGDHPFVMTGQDLKNLSPTLLQLLLDSKEIVFARLTADQKLHIVAALQRKGEIVAVTGDGVNDAPALKAADIGVAMGLNGVEVARTASDMILLDDNFATIVAAIEEGRAVFDNIGKFLTFILTSNIAEAIPFLCYVLFDMPLALTIVQILAVDLGTDLLPALALGAEQARPEVMKRPPRKRGERLLSIGVLSRGYLYLGVMEAAAAMAAFLFVLFAGGWHWGSVLGTGSPLYMTATTATLAAIVAMQIANVYICRDAVQSVFGKGAVRNDLILYGIASEIAVILVISYVPLGNRIFATAPLDFSTLAFIAPFPIAMLAIEEARKAFLRWRLRQAHGVAGG